MWFRLGLRREPLLSFPCPTALSEPALVASIASACDALKQGHTAIFPTDTFFALGANALDPAAIREVFELKGRDELMPLPVLVASVDSMQALSDDVPQEAFAVARRFWPGPLTIVVKRSNRVPQALTGGGPTIGVRVPDHPVALEILRNSGIPIVGTSANPSGTPPTKDLAQIHEWFDGKVRVIVGAPCGRHAAPSTVIDLSGGVPIVVREGAVTFDQLHELLPDVTLGPQR